MIHNNFFFLLFLEPREVNWAFGPLARFVDGTCSCDAFQMNWKNRNKPTKAVRIAKLTEKANLFASNDCMEFMSWRAEAGTARNDEVDEKMK